MSAPVYERIGVGYGQVRQEDPRVRAALHGPLGGAGLVLNVGAGAGSYEPADRAVVAVEPSRTMLAQRRGRSPLVLRGVAGALPFPDGSFDAALAVLTIHHWPDVSVGLAELRRVTPGPVVVLTFDHAVHASQWLVTDYLPEILALDGDLPSPAAVAAALGGGRVEVVPVPWDCQDGFCHAWWRRPEAYLDPAVRAGISGIARLPADVVERGIGRLAGDLASGAWAARHADLLETSEIDAGYRIVVSPGP